MCCEVYGNELSEYEDVCNATLMKATPSGTTLLVILKYCALDELHVLFVYVQETKPLGTVPLAGNKLTRLPDDPKLPNQYRFEITGTCIHMCHVN